MRKLALNEEILLKIEKPARYIGNEVNSVMKDKDKVDIRFAMCFPDVYEIDIPECWIEKTEAFMGLPEIVVMKKTKRSEKEVDIKPMIYNMEACKDGWHLFLATGSEQNLKPDLVMDAFLKYCGEEPQNVPLHFHRLEVYARQDGTPSGYVTLEALGKEISL